MAKCANPHTTIVPFGIVEVKTTNREELDGDCEPDCESGNCILKIFYTVYKRRKAYS